jgi:hypothetical protein
LPAPPEPEVPATIFEDQRCAAAPLKLHFYADNRCKRIAAAREAHLPLLVLLSASLHFADA